jgi:hypothetical protein
VFAQDREDPLPKGFRFGRIALTPIFSSPMPVSTTTSS